MEVYFNLFKVKYEMLLELLRNDPAVNITAGDKVNVFINLVPLRQKPERWPLQLPEGAGPPFCCFTAASQ